MQMERKYIACEVDRLLHILVNVKRLIGFFFFSHQSTRSLTFTLTVLLSPMPDTISDDQSLCYPLRYQQDWFPLYETEKSTLH